MSNPNDILRFDLRPFFKPASHLDRHEQLEQENKAYREQLQKLQELINRHAKQPQSVGTVACQVGPGRALVASSNGHTVVAVPEGVRLEVGRQVLLDSGSGQVFEALDAPVSFGHILTVREVLGDRVVLEVGAASGVATIAHGLEVEPGARVLLDGTNSVALSVVSAAAAVTRSPGVSWDDIGGQHEAKEAIREAIEYPVKYADVYRAHGQKPAKGILLMGPPGTGKTLLGKAVATSLSIDGSADGFIYVKGPEILNKWIGSSEAGVRELFTRARAYTAKTGAAAVIFIDEADALLAARDGGRGQAVSMSQTVVPAFLTEMDGLEESNVFVMLSTNRPETLDAAVVRDGRIDRRIHVGRPSREDAAGILRMALRGRRTADLEALVEHAIKAIHNDDLTLFRLAHDGGGATVRLSSTLSGAMLKGIVAKATEIAVKRDRESGELSDVSPRDVDAAVLLTFSEMAKTDHSGLILECCRGHKLVRAENLFEESLARIRRSMPS